ncbi:MAG: TetR/AcrR family transcriptional regulator [Candidatus Latescibacterota bacterium]|jgi:AcrR family transcriptional regulator
MRKNKKGEIIAATVQLVAQRGVNGASIRRIAEVAGVTEGALYRHFRSKEDLCQQAYCHIVSDMIAAKEEIAASKVDVKTKFEDWVRVSYEYFDRYPDAFTYVVLIPHDFSSDLEHVISRQSNLLSQVIAELASFPDDAMRSLGMGVSHFTGVMLNVPRLINEGVLERPATRYTSEVVGAIWRMFAIDKSPRKN